MPQHILLVEKSGEEEDVVYVFMIFYNIKNEALPYWLKFIYKREKVIKLWTFGGYKRGKKLYSGPLIFFFFICFVYDCFNLLYNVC